MSMSPSNPSNVLRALKSAVIESLESRALLSSTFISPHNLIQTDTLKTTRAVITEQNADYWRPRAGDFSLTRTKGQTPSYINASAYRAFALDESLLQPTIDASNKIIAIPRPDGSIQQFSFEESSVMAPELAAEFPEIKTYAGNAIDGTDATIRFDITPLGFHAQVLQSGQTYYIDPFYHLDRSLYASYWRNQMQKTQSFSFLENDGVEAAARAATSAATGEIGTSAGPITNLTSGTQLRNYRLAVAATGEYTAFFGGTVSGGQAAIVSAVNRVTGIYEKELSIRLTLVANNSSLVFTNASTDPYTNNDGLTMLTQNQTRIDSVIGSANYDIGHVFSTGGGGIAGLGVVGVGGQKAEGVTGSGSPTGDAFWVDYVAHEMGHQFGGNHTFNTSQDPNREPSTAYEPGSGSTIMAYAGIEDTENLQNNSDPFFHWVSQQEIVNYVDGSIPGVGTRTATGNSLPTASAGADYAIPYQTPFALTGSGTDANGDSLTYDWEQADQTTTGVLLTTADNGLSPLFRSYVPSTSPTRTFPQLATILSGLNNTAAPSGGGFVERLPTVARSSMDFRLTVRDNRINGGGIATDDMKINVVNTGSAFSVTSFNTASTVAGGSTQTITWNVANTTASPISTANVQILMSTDGGNTFPTVLLASTPNDASQAVTLPNVASTQVRFKVAAVGNIYFDISNANITLTNAVDTTPPTITSSTFNYLASHSNTVIFSENVSPSITNLANISIHNYSNGTTLTAGQFTSTFNTSTSTATISYNSLILPNGNYRITFSNIADTAGNPLSGTNTVDFFVLAGDANQDRKVNAADQTIVTNNLNTSGKNFSTGDFNNDGSVNSADQTILTNNLNNWLPALGTLSLPSTINIDNVTMTRTSSSQVNITYTSGTIFNLYIGGMSTITFNGGLNNDILTLNYSNGVPFSSNTFTFDGSSGTDSLNIIGTTAIDTAVFGASNITLAGTTITDLNNDSRSFNGNGGKDNLSVTGGSDVQLNAATAQSFTTLSLNGGNANLPANSGEIDAKTLFIGASNYLELNNNNLVVDYTGSSTPFATILNYVKSGLTDLGGNGTSGIRSSYVNNHTIGGTILAVVDNQLADIPANLKLPFVTTSSVIVRFTWFGDADLNGKVDGGDYALTDTGFTGSGNAWLLGDFDYSGTTTNSDYALIDTGFISQTVVL